RQPRLGGEDGPLAHRLVVFGGAREPVRLRIGGDAGGGPARGRRPELRENGAAQLAERDDENGDEDDEERRPAHDGRDPIIGGTVCHYAVGVARFAAMRSGDHYLASLDDGRAVFLDGERVGDVTKHPAFAEPIRRVAQTWDLARAAAAQPTTTYVDPTTGRRHSAMWLVPRSAEDLGARRRVHRLWAEPSYGLMGRTPDHVACVLSAFAGWRQLFDRGGPRFGDNVVRFYERARDADLYVAYGIVPLQIDRSQPAHRQPQPVLYPRVAAERDGGIVVRGAQGITTAAVLADWLFIPYLTPLVPGDR